MKTLKDISKQAKGSTQKALVRVDYNVPLKGNKIVDTRKIDASFATIKALQKKGFQVFLITHLGDGTESLKPIATYLAKHFSVQFITTPIIGDQKGSLLPKMSQDCVVLFENIRRYKQEETNDTAFAKALAQLADIYVNEAFPVSHRAHASLVGVPKYLPSYLGIQFEKEITTLGKLLDNKKHPFLFILGGAKFATKLPLVTRFIDSADQVVVTGATVNTFFKVAGFEVGDSVVEEGYDKPIKKLLASPKLLIPIDAVVLRGNEKGVAKKVTVTLEEVQPGDVIADIGPQTVSMISEKIKKAKVIVWNGPTGWYEKGFVSGSVGLAEAMKNSKAFSVIGGGDTGAVVEKVLGDSTAKNIFISTGGGAALDFLSKGTLPGIKALK